MGEGNLPLLAGTDIQVTGVGKINDAIGKIKTAALVEKDETDGSLSLRRITGEPAVPFFSAYFFKVMLLMAPPRELNTAL